MEKSVKVVLSFDNHPGKQENNDTVECTAKNGTDVNIDIGIDVSIKNERPCINLTVRKKGLANDVISVKKLPRTDKGNHRVGKDLTDDIEEHGEETIEYNSENTSSSGIQSDYETCKTSVFEEEWLSDVHQENEVAGFTNGVTHDERIGEGQNEFDRIINDYNMIFNRSTEVSDKCCSRSTDQTRIKNISKRFLEWCERTTIKSVNMETNMGTQMVQHEKVTLNKVEMNQHEQEVPLKKVGTHMNQYERKVALDTQMNQHEGKVTLKELRTQINRNEKVSLRKMETQPNQSEQKDTLKKMRTQINKHERKITVEKMGTQMTQQDGDVPIEKVSISSTKHERQVARDKTGRQMTQHQEKVEAQVSQHQRKEAVHRVVSESKWNIPQLSEESMLAANPVIENEAKKPKDISIKNTRIESGINASRATVSCDLKHTNMSTRKKIKRRTKNGTGELSIEEYLKPSEKIIQEHEIHLEEPRLAAAPTRTRKEQPIEKYLKPRQHSGRVNKHDTTRHDTMPSKGLSYTSVSPRSCITAERILDKYLKATERKNTSKNINIGRVINNSPTQLINRTPTENESMDDDGGGRHRKHKKPELFICENSMAIKDDNLEESDVVEAKRNSTIVNKNEIAAMGKLSDFFDPSLQLDSYAALIADIVTNTKDDIRANSYDVERADRTQLYPSNPSVYNGFLNYRDKNKDFRKEGSSQFENDDTDIEGRSFWKDIKDGDRDAESVRYRKKGTIEKPRVSANEDKMGSGDMDRIQKLDELIKTLWPD